MPIGTSRCRVPSGPMTDSMTMLLMVFLLFRKLYLAPYVNVPYGRASRIPANLDVARNNRSPPPLPSGFAPLPSEPTGRARPSKTQGVPLSRFGRCPLPQLRVECTPPAEGEVDYSGAGTTPTNTGSPYIGRSRCQGAQGG